MNKTTMALKPFAEKRSNYFTVAFFFLLGIVLVSAKDLGGQLSRDANKEASEKFTFRTSDGQTIKETITLTEYEEDIALEDGSHFIFDYSKGFMVMKLTEDDRVVCTVSNFDRRVIRAPTVDTLEEMKQQELSNLKMSDEVDYFVETGSLVDPSILSERSRDACEGADIYWMYKMEDAYGIRRKRSMECRPYCRRNSDGRVECGVECSIYI